MDTQSVCSVATSYFNQYLNAFDQVDTNMVSYPSCTEIKLINHMEQTRSILSVPKIRYLMKKIR